MLAKLLNAAAIRLTSINPVSEQASRRTSVLIFTSDGTKSGMGTGVLVAPRVVLTAAHNFNEAKARNCRVFVPEDRLYGFKIAGIKFDKQNDMAAVILEQPSKISPCPIDMDSTELKGSATFVLKTVFQRDALPKKPIDLRSSYLHTVLHKGRLIADDTTVGMREGQGTRDVSLFHLASKTGDSGAGIVSNMSGKLLTLNCTGNGDYGVSGPTLKAFRNFVKTLNL